MTYNVFSGTLNPTHFTSLHVRDFALALTSINFHFLRMAIKLLTATAGVRYMLKVVVQIRQHRADIGIRACRP